MAEGLRQRIPWGNSQTYASELEEGAAETIELGEIGEGSALLGEGGALAGFLSIEEGASAIGATGIGVPIGAAVALLAAAGYGVYEIYEHVVKQNPKATPKLVQRKFDQTKKEIKSGTFDEKVHKNEIKQRFEDKKSKNKQPVDFVPLENQVGNNDYVPLEFQNIDKQGFVPPPFKYLGPGNSLNRGPAYNQIDADAEIHDNEYNSAKTKEEVFKSDKDFINKAGDHIAEGLQGKGSISDTIGAALGAIGIGAKHTFEKAIDKVVYPKMPNVKRLQDNEVSSSSDSKKPKLNGSEKIQTDSVDLNVSSDMVLPGTAQGQGGGGDDGPMAGTEIFPLERPLTIQGHKISKFKKVHRFMSFGLAHSKISKIIGPVTGQYPAETQRYITTFLANIPWEKPYMYMTPAEYNLLGPGATCKSVKITIIHRGNRIAFETASSATALATLNNIQNVGVAYGLNKTGWGVDIKPIGFESGKPMKVTNFDFSNVDQDYVKSWYGVKQDANTSEWAAELPDHQLGYKSLLRKYWSLVSSSSQNSGDPMLQSKIQMFDGKTSTNQVIGTFHYSPKIGLLKKQPEFKRYGLPQIANNVNGDKGAQVRVERNIVRPITAYINTTNADKSKYTDNEDDMFDINDTNLISYTSRIEKGPIAFKGLWDHAGDKADLQPSIHVGIQPIPALSTSSLTNNERDYTDCQADFEVVAEMVVEQMDETHYALSTTPDIAFGDKIYAQTKFASYDSCVLGGRHTIENIRLT